MLVGDDDAGRSHRAVPGRPLTFSARPDPAGERARPRTRAVLPRARQPLHHLLARRDSAGLRRVVSELRETERVAARLEARTLDRVIPGEQQPEVEHNVRSEASTTGATHGRLWRDAGGWFSYDLSAGARGPLELLVTYFGGERGRRFDILVDDRPVASSPSTDASRIGSSTSPTRSPPTSSTRPGRRADGPLRRRGRVARRRASTTCGW